MESKFFIFLPLACVALGTCFAHEYTVFHQQSSWSPQKFTQNVFQPDLEDFSASPNPELTNFFAASAAQNKPEEEAERIDDQCTLYKARLTQKELYFQYIRYKTEIPDIKEFTLCIWMRSENLSNDHTIFSYAVDSQAHEIRSWLSNSDRSSYFNLAVGGSNGKGGGESVHLFSINYPFRRRRWYHTCQSWSSVTGNWLIYVEGERIGAGNSPETVGKVIRGGGVAVTGQTQSQPGGGFIEEGGFEGEVTLFKLLPRAFSRPLKIADLEGARMYQTSCDGLCKKNPGPATIGIRSHPRASESRLTPQAREVLSLSPNRPIRVAERSHAASQERNAYNVREEGTVGTPNPTPLPHTFTQFNKALHRQVLFQTTPVADGGVQLFTKAEGRRVTRSLDHFLLDHVPPATHLAEDVFVYRPKLPLLPDAFVPDLDFGHRYGPLAELQVALQAQLDRQLLGQDKPSCIHGAQTGQNARDRGGNRKMAVNKRPAPATSTANQVMVAVGNDGNRETASAAGKMDAGRPNQETEGVGLLVAESALVTEVRPIIDWRMTPKKLYAGSMWLRANPVCRKF